MPRPGEPQKIATEPLTVRADGQDQVLGQHDSCTIAPNTEREIINLGNDVVTMVVVMPYPVPAP